MKRVVVTGMGAVTPLGSSLHETWMNMKLGKVGIKSLISSSDRFAGLPVTIAAKVSDSFPTTASSCWNDPSTSTVLPRVIQYALAASTEALKDARIILNGGGSDDDLAAAVAAERLGVCIGTGIGNLEGICTSHSNYEKKGISRVSPFFVPNILCNGPAGHVAKRFKAKALVHSVSTACTTQVNGTMNECVYDVFFQLNFHILIRGLHSIGDAHRFICHGDADVIIAGASESCIHPMTFAGFSR